MKFICGSLLFLLFSLSVHAATSRAEIEAFNQKFLDATLKMDNAASLALWAEDGVSLLPNTAPIVGKKAIAKFLDDVMTQIAGYKVTGQVNDFHDIQVSGDWATEWGMTHQSIQPPDGKPMMEIYGKILLVLHREKDGWHIAQEMWNSAPKQ